MKEGTLYKHALGFDKIQQFLHYPVEPDSLGDILIDWYFSKVAMVG